MTQLRRPLAIVTDIEGTTSSIAFVHEVLFPYARARLADYIAANPQEVAPILDAVRAEAGDPALDTQGCTDLLLAWHDADRKIGPLKTLQGLIWQQGYRAGDLRGHVYADAAAALQRWHRAGIRLYVYSSGSVAAQKLLFGATDYGDLTSLFRGHFDTAIGAKKEAGSYRAIAAALALAPADILFLSDIAAELEAAQAAGFQVLHLVRDGALPQDPPFPAVRDFTTVLPEEIPV